MAKPELGLVNDVPALELWRRAHFSFGLVLRQVLESRRMWSFVENLVALLVAGAETGAQHWPALVWLAGGALLWGISAPFRGLFARLYGELGFVVYKWAGLTQACLHRYRSYVRSTAVLESTPSSRLWKSFEAMLATPMVILRMRRENEDGLGRLLYKWLDAFHAYWCVFLPESTVFAWRSAAKYWNGLGIESKRTLSRGLAVARVAWSLVSLVLFTVVYVALFAYETIEALCFGPIGLFALIGATSGFFVRLGAVEDGELPLFAEVVICEKVAWFDGAVLVVAVLGRIWRWFEASEASPWQRAASGYEQWLHEMEEHEQSERLSRAFWQADGAIEGQPPSSVRTLSQLRADQRALQADIRAAELLDARRGRRAPVGEDVPSRIGGNRLGRGLRPA